MVSNVDAPLSFDSMVGSDDADDHVDESPVAAQEDRPPAPAGGFIMVGEGDIDFGADELDIPRLRLAQGISSEVGNGIAKAGQWLLTGYDPADAVDFIPVGFQRTRELRDGDRKIVCQSPNAKVGYGSPGGTCDRCPMAQWIASADPNQRNTPPPCNLVYNYLGISHTHQTVVRLSLSKTAIEAAKFINTMIASRKLGNVGIRLTSVYVDGGNRKYQKAKATLSEIDVNEVRSLVEKYQIGALQG